MVGCLVFAVVANVSDSYHVMVAAVEALFFFRRCWVGRVCCPLVGPEIYLAHIGKYFSADEKPILLPPPHLEEAHLEAQSRQAPLLPGLKL